MSPLTVLESCGFIERPLKKQGEEATEGDIFLNSGFHTHVHVHTHKHTDTQMQKILFVYEIILFKLASAVDSINKFLVCITLMKQDSSYFVTVEKIKSHKCISRKMSLK